MTECLREVREYVMPALCEPASEVAA
jgi:hypothetical protein